MAQRLEWPDDIAADIAARIVHAVRPWRIVLFGSRARGDPSDHSDYDVYVEIDDAGTSLRAIDRRIRALFVGCKWSVDFKVRRPGEIERRRDDPGTIEWDVAREGHVLYADPAAPTALATPRRIGESSPEPPASLYEWLETAERDLRHCHDLWATGREYSPEICWLSHQTSEKYMKALLVSRRLRPERTHDLSRLLDALRVAGCTLPDLDADCALLATHAIVPRYPAGLDLGIDDARAAFAAAEHVVSAVRAQLPPRVH